MSAAQISEGTVVPSSTSNITRQAIPGFTSLAPRGLARTHFASFYAAGCLQFQISTPLLYSQPHYFAA